ncbi:MAG: UDP-2,3-diacylglucosamine diphosphatase LpxI [Deltaproteobacteria bacterium]
MSNGKIGIVAGGGQFPYLFAQSARKQGRPVVIIAHEGESAPELSNVSDSIYWIKLGQLGKIIKYFHRENVTEAVFLGTITKTRIFRDVMPDLKGLLLWNKIDIRQDDAILRAFAAELEKEGIVVRESTMYLKELLFPTGILGRRRPTEEQREDIRFGWNIARAIGELDIGQSVVVRHRSVLAVEAIEGTDAAIRRGGLLGEEKAVVVKVKKPRQDYRFDLPAIGLTTIDTMKEVRASVLAVEAGHALLFDKETVIHHADRAGIVIVGVTEQDGELLID